MMPKSPTYSGILRDLYGSSSSHMCWLFVEKGKEIVPVLCDWKKMNKLKDFVGQKITWTIDPMTNYLKKILEVK
jgi:hypothetical protein